MNTEARPALPCQSMIPKKVMSIQRGCVSKPYEQHGDVDRLVFRCSTTLAPDGDTLRVYYVWRSGFQYRHGHSHRPGDASLVERKRLTNEDILFFRAMFFPAFHQEVLMNFHKGDTVMHWTHGIGQIVNLEERDLAGSKTIYDVVQVRDMTVWGPADGKVKSRLRSPIPKPRFQRLLAILSSPSEPLPEDWLERNNRLQELLQDGRPESLCQRKFILGATHWRETF
jgi:hypothetical protein